MACADLQRAFKITSGTIASNLITAGYSQNTSLSTKGKGVFAIYWE